MARLLNPERLERLHRANQCNCVLDRPRIDPPRIEHQDALGAQDLARSLDELHVPVQILPEAAPAELYGPESLCSVALSSGPHRLGGVTEKRAGVGRHLLTPCA